MSTPYVEPVIFRQEQILAFRDLSHDHNPLHLDSLYARRTQFGQVVVYGILTTLKALQLWGRGRKFQLKWIKGTFKKPLFLDQPYQLEAEEKGNKVILKWGDGATSLSSIQFEWTRQESQEPLYTEQEEASYCPDIQILRQLLQEGTLLPQIPTHQISALLWASYTVGMEHPGQQALFTNFRFDFENTTPQATDSPNLTLRPIEVSEHPELHLLEVTGAGTGIKQFTLEAYRRPPPISYPLSEIKDAVGASDRYRGKTVAILGASRGIGSVLAQSFALHGADIVLIYRSGHEEAQILRAEIEGLGRKVKCIQGDLGAEQDVQQIQKEIQEHVGKLDWIVNNAFPTIHGKPFFEQSPTSVANFVHHSFALSVNAVFYLAPLLQPGGNLVFISTEYAKTPVPNFSHYIAAKTAVEGLAKALSSEMPESRNIVIRFPRVLTDQTNTLVDLDPAPRLSFVIKQVLESLEALPKENGFYLLEPSKG